MSRWSFQERPSTFQMTILPGVTTAVGAPGVCLPTSMAVRYLDLDRVSVT
jgi:hypothetical protein